MADEAGHATTGRRLEVLRVLKESPTPLTIQEIAEQLTVHVNTVRFHLDTLVANGQVERIEGSRRTTTGRPPLAFRPAAGMDPTGPRSYRLLAELLVRGMAADPDARVRAVESGRDWGRTQCTAERSRARKSAAGAVVELVEMLDEIGFEPELLDGRPRRGRPAQVAVRNCPFLELTADGSDLVCSIHLGLMLGALEAWQAPVTVSDLEPFAESGLCRVRLTAT